MKTLEDFKRRLRVAVDNPDILVSTSRIDKNGNVLGRSPPCPVSKVQSRDFIITLPDGRKAYMEFKKAKDWEFGDNTATHTGLLGGKTVVTFNK